MHDSAIEYSFAQVLIKKYTGGKYFIVIISSINAYVLFWEELDELIRHVRGGWCHDPEGGVKSSQRNYLSALTRLIYHENKTYAFIDIIHTWQLSQQGIFLPLNSLKQ